MPEVDLASVDEDAREAFMAFEWLLVILVCFGCNVAFFAFNDEGSRKQRPFLSALTDLERRHVCKPTSRRVASAVGRRKSVAWR